MARQVEPREDCGEVRRTELTGSTRSLAPRCQANQLAPRGIVVLKCGHRSYCRASQRRCQPNARAIATDFSKWGVFAGVPMRMFHVKHIGIKTRSHFSSGEGNT